MQIALLTEDPLRVVSVVLKTLSSNLGNHMMAAQLRASEHRRQAASQTQPHELSQNGNAKEAQEIPHTPFSHCETGESEAQESQTFAQVTQIMSTQPRLEVRLVFL